jgi:4-amino-4-deoxy-L-arabinose transferase-like glycosyltransferase
MIELKKPKPSADTFFPLILLIWLASLLRFYNLGERSFWYDEAASVRNVMGLLKLPPYADWGLLGMLRAERIPPLYFMYLVPFYQLSHSEWLMRVASVLFGIVTIPLMYHFGTRLFNRTIGFIGALLLAFSPLHIFYSQDLRPYSLFLFFSIAIFYLSFLVLEKGRNIHYVGLIIVSVLGIYTYTYTIFPLLIVNLYFIMRCETNRHLLRRWVLSHLIIVILSIGEFYHTVYHIAASSTKLSDFPFGWRSIVATPYLFTVGRVFFPTKSNLILTGIQGVVFGGGLLAGVWALWQRKASERRALPFFIAAMVTYLAICIISFGIMPLFDESRVNYIIFFLPFYYLLIAKGWTYLPSLPLKRAMVGLAVLFSLVSIYPFYFDWDQVGKGNFRDAALYARRNFEQNDVVYHVTGQSYLSFAYYFDWQVPQIPISEGNPNDVNSGRLWLVYEQEKGGLDFSLNSSQEEQGSTQTEQTRAALACNSYVTSEKFQLIDLQIFPGKNELIVCLYRLGTTPQAAQRLSDSGLNSFTRLNLQSGHSIARGD